MTRLSPAVVDSADVCPTASAVSRLRRFAAVGCAAAMLTAVGCNNAGEGAASGAALGALAGMGLGSLSGDMGKGAAAGAIIGGVGGAVLGDQNERARQNSSYPPPRNPYRTRDGYGQHGYHGHPNQGYYESERYYRYEQRRY